MNYPLKTLLAATTLLTLSAAQADTGTFGSYIGIDSSYYGATQPGSTTTTAFNGADLGSFVLGSSSYISDAELLTWKNGSSDVTGATLNYSVDGGAWQSVAINFGNNGATDVLGNSYASGGNQAWDGLTSGINYLSGLSVGEHTLSVYFNSTTSTSNVYDSNNGANYTADFSITSAPVPEPGSLALLMAGLGTVGFVARRKSR